MKKRIALILAVVLLLGIAVGATIAWLTDSTEEVKNTFTTSTIGVELDETEREYKMIPGWTIDKDPWAKITADSEDGYLFVQVTSNMEITKNENGTYSVGEYLDYAIDTQWTLVDGTTNVFYIENPTKGAAYNILGEGTNTYDGEAYSWADDQVLVKPTVTKEMMAALTDEPTLTFQAYATQLKKNNTTKFTAAEAWELVEP